MDYLMSTNKSSVLGLNTLNRESIMKGNSTMNLSLKDSISPDKKNSVIENSGGKVIKCCKLCNIPEPETCWRRQMIYFLRTKCTNVLVRDNGKHLTGPEA